MVSNRCKYLIDMDLFIWCPSLSAADVDEKPINRSRMLGGLGGVIDVSLPRFWTARVDARRHRLWTVAENPNACRSASCLFLNAQGALEPRASLGLIPINDWQRNGATCADEDACPARVVWRGSPLFSECFWRSIACRVGLKKPRPVPVLQFFREPLAKPIVPLRPIVPREPLAAFGLCQKRELGGRSTVSH